jgi:hypothetical protein
MFMAIVAWFWLPEGPGSAWFLNEEERVFAVARIAKDHVDHVLHDHDSDGIETIRISRRDFLETARDWKTWYLLVFNICASVPNQTFSVFLPIVVQGLGYSPIKANLVSEFQCPKCHSTLILTLHTQMSVPPYVCGAAGLYLFALSSDHQWVDTHNHLEQLPLTRSI